MRVRDILSEGRDAPLFHATNYQAALSIIGANRIAPNPDRPQLVNGKSVLGVSLTRRWDLATQWARVVFELDQSAVVTRHRVVPFSMDGTHRPNAPTRLMIHDPDNPFSTRRNHGERNTRMEAEEFCVGGVSPLRPYVIKVHILADRPDDPAVEAVRKACEERGFPYVITNDPDQGNTLLRRK
jgi:hypothetical protein